MPPAKQVLKVQMPAKKNDGSTPTRGRVVGQVTVQNEGQAASTSQSPKPMSPGQRNEYPNGLRCLDCAAVVATRQELCQHKNVCPKRCTTKVYNCYQCGSMFYNYQELVDHRRIMHKGGKNNPPETSPTGTSPAPQGTKTVMATTTSGKQIKIALPPGATSATAVVAGQKRTVQVVQSSPGGEQGTPAKVQRMVVSPEALKQMTGAGGKTVMKVMTPEEASKLASQPGVKVISQKTMIQKGTIIPVPMEGVGDGTIMCCECGMKRFLTRRDLYLHKKSTCTGKQQARRFICLCGQSFSSAQLLKKHNEQFHSKGQAITDRSRSKEFLTCLDCGELFHRWQLTPHKLECRENFRTRKFPCDFCENYNALSRTALHTHVTTYHPDVAPSDTPLEARVREIKDEMPKICYDCGQSIPAKHFADHKREKCKAMGKAKVFSCFECHEMFVTRKELEDHKKDRHLLTGSSYMCGMCGKNFTVYIDLCQHYENTHRKYIGEGRVQKGVPHIIAEPGDDIPEDILASRKRVKIVPITTVSSPLPATPAAKPRPAATATVTTATPVTDTMPETFAPTAGKVEPVVVAPGLTAQPADSPSKSPGEKQLVTSVSGGNFGQTFHISIDPNNPTSVAVEVQDKQQEEEQLEEEDDAEDEQEMEEEQEQEEEEELPVQDEDEDDEEDEMQIEEPEFDSEKEEEEEEKAKPVVQKHGRKPKQSPKKGTASAKLAAKSQKKGRGRPKKVKEEDVKEEETGEHEDDEPEKEEDEEVKQEDVIVTSQNKRASRRQKGKAEEAKATSPKPKPVRMLAPVGKDQVICMNCQRTLSSVSAIASHRCPAKGRKVAVKAEKKSKSN